MSSLYRVEKCDQEVVLFLIDGTVQKGVVFLSHSVYSHIGEQTLMDLLKDRGDFFAFRDEAGQFKIINKHAVTHIRYVKAKEEEGQKNSFGEEISVKIEFIGGETLLGMIRIEMPEGRNRLFDFINASDGFFAIEGSEFLSLVNSSLIRDIAPAS